MQTAGTRKSTVRRFAGDVAAALKISPSTFSKHLAAAQRKLLEPIHQP